MLGWNVRKGRPVRRFEGAAGDRVTGMAVDLDDALLAVGDTRSVRIWDTKTGLLKERFMLPDARVPGRRAPRITAVGQVFEESHAVIGDDHGRVMVLDLEEGHIERLYQTDLGVIRDVVGGVEWLAASGESRTIVLDRRREPVPLPLHGELNGVSLWDMHATIGALVATDGTSFFRWGPDFSRPPIAQLGPDDGIQAFASDAGGRRGIILTDDDVVELRIIAEGKVLHRRPLAARRPMPVVASDVWGEYMVSVDTRGALTWPFEDLGVERYLWNAPVLHTVRFIEGSHNVVTAGETRLPVIYNIDHPLELIPYREPASTPIHQGVPHEASNVYYASTESGQVAVYALRAGRLTETLNISAGTSPRLALSHDASRLAISPSTREGLRPGQGERILIWDVSANDVEAEVTVGSDVVGVAFGPSAGTLYYLTRSAELEGWGIDDDARQRRFDDFNDIGRCLRVDPLGALIAVGGDRGVSFYNARFDFLSAAEIGPVQDIAFSPDGAWAVAAVEDGSVYILRFDENTPLTIEPLAKLASKPMSIDVSDDSRLIAIAESRGAVSFFVNDAEDELIEPHATLLVQPFMQWMVHRPDHVYHGSADLERVLFFDIDREVRPIKSQGINWGRSADAIEKTVRLPDPDTPEDLSEAP